MHQATFAEGATGPHQAGPTAPLPYHSLTDLFGTLVTVTACPPVDSEGPARHRPRVRMYVHCTEGLASLPPALARELAVYLVDCANALDNPAARVIADETDRFCGTCAHDGRQRDSAWCGTCTGHDAGAPTNWERRDA